MLDKEDVEVFAKAKELGIHRTVHAGEAGPALMVKKVIIINYYFAKIKFSDLLEIRRSKF